MKTQLHLVEPSLLERAKAEEQKLIEESLDMAWLLVGRLHVIAKLHFSTVCISDTAPRLAEHMAREIERMAVSLKNGGRIR